MKFLIVILFSLLTAESALAQSVTNRFRASELSRTAREFQPAASITNVGSRNGQTLLRLNTEVMAAKNFQVFASEGGEWKAVANAVTVSNGVADLIVPKNKQLAVIPETAAATQPVNLSK